VAGSCEYGNELDNHSVPELEHNLNYYYHFQFVFAWINHRLDPY
jgi:hypothetical protein